MGSGVDASFLDVLLTTWSFLVETIDEEIQNHRNNTTTPPHMLDKMLSSPLVYVCPVDMLWLGFDTCRLYVLHTHSGGAVREAVCGHTTGSVGRDR
eukprot:1392940-Amorphochlora_amoeboformis.AAC.1